MSWFEQFVIDVKAAGYVRLIADIPAPWGYYEHTGPRQHGNIEAFWYKGTKEPGRDPRGWSDIPLWRIMEKYKINGGAGNGGTGVHQHQVTLIGDMRIPAGYYIYDFRDVVNEQRLGKPVFSKIVTYPCRWCKFDISYSDYTKFGQAASCDSCLYGDD
jgi:hypothetical protein